MEDQGVDVTLFGCFVGCDYLQTFMRGSCFSASALPQLLQLCQQFLLKVAMNFGFRHGIYKSCAT